MYLPKARDFPLFRACNTTIVSRDGVGSDRLRSAQSASCWSALRKSTGNARLYHGRHAWKRRSTARKITFWRMKNGARGSRENKRARPAKPKGVFGGPLRAAIYARVSTNDQHTIPEQVRQLEEFAKRRGWVVAAKVREVASGAAKRPKRDELLAAAHRREIDAVLVWKLDRWGRSVADLVATLSEFIALDVTFVSMTEAIDLSTPSGRALATMLATFAEFERDMLRERVRSGLERVRREGKRLGRPPTAASQATKVKALRSRHLTHAEIARRLKIGESSVRRILAR